MFSDLALEIVLLLAAAAFLAGFVDSIAGGGGLITVPVLLLAGFSPVEALGTNKLQVGEAAGRSAAFESTRSRASHTARSVVAAAVSASSSSRRRSTDSALSVASSVRPSVECSSKTEYIFLALAPWRTRVAVAMQSSPPVVGFGVLHTCNDQTRCCSVKQASPAILSNARKQVQASLCCKKTIAPSSN